jgi:hypothetical protein
MINPRSGETKTATWWISKTIENLLDAVNNEENSR